MVVSDVVLDAPLPAWAAEQAVAIAGCVAGAALRTDYLAAIRAAGLVDLEVLQDKSFGEVALALLPETVVAEARAANIDVESIARSVRSLTLRARNMGPLFRRFIPMVDYIGLERVQELVARLGAARFIEGLANEIEADYRRWHDFDKSPRHATHSPVGVIELMPISDGSLYSFKYVNGHPQNRLDELVPWAYPVTPDLPAVV